MKNIFAFDFSCNKTAMCSYINNELNFHIFPLNIDAKSKDILESAGINVYDRNLSPIKKGQYDSHTLIVIHVKRAIELADLIIQTITNILNEHNITDYSNIIVANESFSFGSKGDATLQLSGYKFVLMERLIALGFELRTYSPISIKSTAGCSHKGMTKEHMINKLAEEDISLHKLFKIIKESPQQLKKKTQYCMCIDDIADAYWCYKTTKVKELK